MQRVEYPSEPALSAFRVKSDGKSRKMGAMIWKTEIYKSVEIFLSTFSFVLQWASQKKEFVRGLLESNLRYYTELRNREKEQY